MGLRDALKTGGNYFFVLQSGMISSAVVLLMLWAMAQYWPRVNVIGWYYTIVPVGAIAAGVAAALGYILAAMHAQASVPRWFSVPIILLQFSVYIAADYVEYRRLMWDYAHPPLSYSHYFRIRSRSLRLVDGHGEESSVSGYALRAIEMAGFAAPGLLVPLCVSSMPRCRKCQGHRTSRKIMTLLSAPELSFEDWRSAHKSEDFDTEWEARANYFQEHVTHLLRPLTDAIAANQPESIQAAVEALRIQSDAVAAPHCISVLEADYCKTCFSGRLIVTYRYQERGRPRFDGLPTIPIETAILNALTARTA